MRDGVTFIHLSDLHLGDPGDPTLLSDTASALADVVGLVGRMAPAPGFVAISGDLSNRGDPDSYRALRAALALLPRPVFCGLGDHDDRRGYAAGWPGEGRAGDAPCFADPLVAGAHLVVLDTGVAGRVGGAIDAAQFARLGS